MDSVQLLFKCKQGDKAAREQMIMENVGLVWSIVRRFLGRGYEADDLFQIGSIGLIKAIDKFDLSFEVQFSTYAVPMIMGEIKRFLRDDGLVKVSRTVKENAWKIHQASEQLEHTLGREATLEEIAAATELRREDIVMALEAGAEVESIYRAVYQGDGSEICMVDQIVSGNEGAAGRISDGSSFCDREKEDLLNRIMLEELLGQLQEEERRLIELRYYEEKTQMEVAKELGISQVQVSRLEKKILLKLRARA
ncbi:MAG: SigB/SigF/SigG family RNA polymerase sigma factor [Lachnospiraceae bacterium]|nr:SigB/SigF/SigG family RNA polymerase sigma factor [Lachnospiraceae bacterium]